MEKSTENKQHLCFILYTKLRRQLEPELAFWSKLAIAKAAHVLFLVPL